MREWYWIIQNEGELEVAELVDGAYWTMDSDMNTHTHSAKSVRVVSKIEYPW